MNFLVYYSSEFSHLCLQWHNLLCPACAALCTVYIIRSFDTFTTFSLKCSKCFYTVSTILKSLLPFFFPSHICLILLIPYLRLILCTLNDDHFSQFLLFKYKVETATMFQLLLWLLWATFFWVGGCFIFKINIMGTGTKLPPTFCFSHTALFLSLSVL